MELVYSVSRPLSGRKDWLRDEVPLCCLSPRNIIAFTTTMDLSNGDRMSAVESVYHIYVCDMDKPWDVYAVASYHDNVVALRWNTSGTRLLVATSCGACHVWEMQRWLFNEWEKAYSTVIEGEDIVAISWLHNGIHMNFNADRRDSPHYSDKITHAKFSPSLSQFGGKAMEGWIAITSTGMVCVGVLKKAGAVSVQLESLAPWRARILHADIAHDPSGDILIAVSDGTLSTAIKCYRISLKSDKESCSISCKPTASFYAKCHTEVGLRESSTSRVTHVQFLSSESGETLIIGAGDTNMSRVELWSLTNQMAGLHRLCKGTGGNESSYAIHRWMHKSTISHGSLPISIAVPRFPVIYNTTDPSNMLFQYVAIAYRDGSVKLVNRSSFQSMTTTNLDTGISEPVGGEKRRRMLPYIVHMQQTFTGCGLVGVDQYSCLYVMKAVNTRDPVTQVVPAYLVGMLEYAILMGYDWWNVNAALRPGVVESVIGKLRDHFLKQPPAMQEVLAARHLAVKQSLYRCSSSSLRASDCHAHFMLLALSNAFKSTLRPKAITAVEMSPSEKLAANCSKNFEVDLDKVVVTLNHEKKEFFVEPPTLQALQPLIQWVGDLTLYLLTALPTSQSYATFPGANLLQDPPVLGLLREMLVLIRIWGLITPACLPHFTTTSNNFDCMAQLFKLLTKVWLSRREGGGVDFDEGIIDECCLLPSQVIVPPVHQGLFGNMDYDNSIYAQQHPVTYTFGEVPRHAVQAANVQLPDGQQMCHQQMDIIRQVSLGSLPPSPTRQCSRCGLLSLMAPLSKVPAVRAWDLRWAQHCLCGGHWKSASREKPNSTEF